MNELAARVHGLFTNSFSGTPSLYFSPGRINLIGEHIDYNDGFVLPAAISKGIYYAVGRNETNSLHFYAADAEEWFSVDIPGIKKNTGWRNYVLSVVNEFLLLEKNIQGFNCVFAGNIPGGSGMSSSAAVEGGLAFALNELFGCGLTRVELALLCQRAEHNFPGVQCGIMDQFANMMGRKDEVILLDCCDLSASYFPLVLDGCEIVLLNSKVHHSLASSEYNLRRKQCAEGLAILQGSLGIHSFRDITDSSRLLPFKEKMGEKVYARCKYVIEETGRTTKAARLLQQKDLPAFGQLMYQSHEGLRDLYEVSCPELDLLVEEAKKNPAVIGARMMGGGFGGCTINIVEAGEKEAFIRNTLSAYEGRFSVAAEAYEVQIGNGVYTIE